MENLIRKSCLIWVYLAGAILISIVLVTVLNIGAFGLDKIARNFNFSISGISGYEDYIELTMSCVTLMFFPYTQLERGHVSVDFFAEKLSTRTQIFMDKIWLFVTLCLVIFLAYFMYLGLFESKDDDAVSSILGWSKWPFYIPGIISLVMWAIVLVYQIFFKRNSLEVSKGLEND